jgi:hypothetical protein
MYQYVWQNKRPLVAFDQLCLPIAKGGLGLIHPEKQHMVLQKKFLEHIFDQSTIDSAKNIITPLLFSFLKEIQPQFNEPAISFFVPEFRKHDINHPTSIIHTMYKAFDHFQIQYQYSEVPLATLMKFPATHFLQSLPSDYWLRRYPKLTASQVFIYEPEEQFIRLRLPTEFESHPRLLKRLFHDIFDTRLVALQPFVWEFIENNMVYNEEDIDISLAQQLVSNPLWTRFSSKRFRLHNYTGALSRTFRIPQTKMKIFWSATMLLPARNLWYRVLSNKVPHGLIVHLMKIIESSTCVLCREAVDDFKHFVFYCRVKADIWYNILQARFPSVDITLEKILPTLCSLELPSFIPLNDAPHYYTIVSTIQYGIWLHYWKQSIDQIPFDPTKVQLYIDTQLDILLTASFND